MVNFVAHGLGVTVTITSKSLQSNAIFKAIYIDNQTYEPSDWACIGQPEPLPTLANFTKAAKAESAINIVKNATPLAQGWVNLGKDDLQKQLISTTNNKVIFSITSNSKSEVAQFSATYTNNQSYKVSAWKCSIQPHPQTTLAAFIKAAKKESAPKIVKNATPKANNWVTLPKDDLKKELISATNNKVIFRITSISKNEVAQFSATYIENQAYQVSDWKCSIQPKEINNFIAFTKAAKAESAVNIVKNATPSAGGWNNLPDKDLSKKFIEAVQNVVVLEITSDSKHEVAHFTATYTNNQTYKVSDWKCSSQPKKINNFIDFTKDAKAETSINIVKNATPSAYGWNNLGTKDLSKKFISATNNIVIFEIASDSKNEVAQFSATYIENQAYQVSDWKCSQQPIPDWRHNEVNFLTNQVNNPSYNSNMINQLKNKSLLKLAPNLAKFLNKYSDPTKSLIMVVDKNSLIYTRHGGVKKLGEITFKLNFYAYNDPAKKQLITGGLFYVDKELDNSGGDSGFNNLGIKQDIN